MDLADLIGELERATCGSRELDIAIARYLTPDREFRDEMRECVGFGDAKHGIKTWAPVPKYSSSVDSALTLIPDGFYLDLHDWTWAEEPTWCASLQAVKGLRRHISEKGATAALALCIAALRSRQSTDSTFPSPSGTGETGTFAAPTPQGRLIEKEDGE